MKKVVILGSGLATRLRPITSHIPKVLVNYGHHTILKHLYDMYTDLGAQEIIVVVHSKFINTVNEYSKQQGLKITALSVDEAYGSAYAISRINGHIEGHNVIFNWCDVVPEFGEFSWDTDAIYTFGHECRYEYDGDVIREVGNTGGNVVGVYQSNKFSILHDYDSAKTHEMFRGRDYVEVLKSQTGIKNIPLNHLVDLGDSYKLKKAHINVSACRDFNKISVNDTSVIKSAVNEKGKDLQQLELAWYDKVVSNAIPVILGQRRDDDRGISNFKMERIFGLPLYKDWHHSRLSEVFNVLDFGPEKLYPPCEQIRADHRYEIVEKLTSRYNEISEVVNSFPKVEIVNGTRIGRLPDMLERAYNHIISHAISVPYKVIHGDPNFSNILSELDTSNLRVIDPRGYFGQTKIFGPKMYDEAKVLYALSGYDKFNSDPLWGGLEFNYGNEAFVTIDSLDDFSQNDSRFTELHHLWKALIWLGLGGYFKNNPLKSVAAHYYGMYLLSNALDKLGRRLKDGGCAFETNTRSYTLKTKCPDKWLLIDLETGSQFKPNFNDTFSDKPHWAKL